MRQGVSVTLHVNAVKTEIQNAIAGKYKGEGTFKEMYLSNILTTENMERIE